MLMKAQARKKQIKNWLNRERKLEDILVDYEKFLGLSMAWMDYDIKVAHIIDVFHNGWDERHPKEIMGHVKNFGVVETKVAGAATTTALAMLDSDDEDNASINTLNSGSTTNSKLTRKNSKMNPTINNNKGSGNVVNSAVPKEWNNLKNVSKMNLNGMAKCSKDLNDLVRKRVNCVLTLKYTKMAMPYGWVEKLNSKRDVVGYFNTDTDEGERVSERANAKYDTTHPKPQNKQTVSKEQPEFTFEEELATRKLQSAWRALEGKRSFEKKLKNESILGVLQISVKESARHAWLNYKQEGMTLEMWLTRLGLGSHYTLANTNYLKEMRKTTKSQPTNSNSRRGTATNNDLMTPSGRRSSRLESGTPQTPSGGGGGGNDGGRRGTRRGTSFDLLSSPQTPHHPSTPNNFRISENSPLSQNRALATPSSRGRSRSRSGVSMIGNRSSMSPDTANLRRKSSVSPSGGGDAHGHRQSIISSRGSMGGASDDGGGFGAHANHGPPQLTLDVFLRKCRSDDWLKLLGFKQVSAIHLIQAMQAHSIEAAKNFSFLNYYENEHDLRSIKMCVKDKYENLYNIVSKKYKNNPNRVEKIVDELQKSNYPITIQQLTSFLDRYEGKPAMAQENVVKEMVNVKTTSSVKDEKVAYSILKAGIDRVSVLLRNLGVTALTERLEKATTEAIRVINEGGALEKIFEDEQKFGLVEGGGGGGGTRMSQAQPNTNTNTNTNTTSSAILATMGGGGGGGGSAAAAAAAGSDDNRLHSGHEAKAGLILRRDGCQVVIDWWQSSILCQKRFRGHVQLVNYRILVKKRVANATKIQKNVRRAIFATNLKSHLLNQQKSNWEQLFNEDNNCYYWFNKNTLESAWSEPSIPYRPMIRDRFTQVLMQAWPNLDIDDVEEVQASPGICMICKVSDGRAKRSRFVIEPLLTQTLIILLGAGRGRDQELQRVRQEEQQDQVGRRETSLLLHLLLDLPQ